jgi:hypothetical protein
MLLLAIVKVVLFLMGVLFAFLWGRVMYELRSVGGNMAFLPGNSLFSKGYSAFFRGASSHLLRAVTLTLVADAVIALVVLLCTFSFESALEVYEGVSPSAYIFFAALLVFSPLGRQGLTQKLSTRLSVSYDRKRLFSFKRIIVFHLADPKFTLTTTSLDSAMQEIVSIALKIRSTGAKEGFGVRSWLLAPAKSRKNQETRKFQKIFRLPECLIKLHPGAKPAGKAGLTHTAKSIFAVLVCMGYLIALRTLRIRRARNKTPKPTGKLRGVNNAIDIVKKNFPNAKVVILPIDRIAVFDAIHIVGHFPGEGCKLNAWTAGYEFS